MAHYVVVEPVFKLSDTNKFGGFLINSLRHKKHIRKSDLNFTVGETSITVQIPEYYETHFGIFIPKNAQFRFVKFLFDDFNDRMLDHVYARATGKKGDIRKALLDFRNKYYITEEELPFTTLKKQYERALTFVTACKSA